QGLHVVGAIGVAAGPDLSPDDLIGAFGASPTVVRSPADPDLPLVAVAAVVSDRPLAEAQQDLDDAAPVLSLVSRSAEGVLEAISDQAAVLDTAGVIVRANRAWLEVPAAHRAAVERSPVGTHYPAALAGQDSRPAQIAADGIRSVLAGALPGFQSEYD